MRQMMMILLVTLVVLVCKHEAVSKPDFNEALLVEDHLICHSQGVVLDFTGTKQIHALKFAANAHGFSDILVRRVELHDLSCGTIGSNEFGKAVDFCCNDAGSEILIELQAFNSKREMKNCMVEIRIVEGGSLTVQGCLPDLVVPCDTPINPNHLSNLGNLVTDESDQQPIIINGKLVGFDGLIQSKCGTESIDSKKITINEIVDIEETTFCGQGYSITRTFQIGDKGGVSSTCTQRIQVLGDQTPFLVSDIIWPSDTTAIGCLRTEFDIAVYGVPLFPTADCEQLAISHTDEFFEVNDANCTKLIRNWTVVNWCTFDANRNTGIWKYQQIIIIENTVAPEIRNCDPISICVNKNSCEALLAFDLEATDDCLQRDELLYMYALSLNGDNDSRLIRNSRTVSEYLPVGQHTIQWTVNDGCNNTATCSHLITVEDCQTPSIICLGQFTSALPDLGLEVAPVVEIWANDLIKGPLTNCTPVDNAVISFSKDSIIQVVEFGCADIGENNVELVVIGSNGTHSSCITKITIQDNRNLCGPGLRAFGDVAGSIISENGIPIPEVEIVLNSNDDTYSSVSNSDGKYQFEHIPFSEDYDVALSKNSNPLDGVSVRDLVLLQNHIIGKESLQSAYQVIAGDMDLSSHLSIVDLVQLKAILLGKSTYENAWSFIDKETEFLDPMSPWPMHHDNTIEVNSKEESFSFIGIKKGDLDHSSMGDQTEFRTVNPTIIPYSVIHSNIEFDLREVDAEMLHFKLSSSSSVDIQFGNEGLSTNDLSSEILGGMHYYSILLDNSIVDKSTVLVKNLTNVNNLSGVAVNEKLQESTVKFELVLKENAVSVVPNPFGESLQLTIESAESDAVIIQLMDVSGALILHKPQLLQEGSQQLHIDIPKDLQKGVYFLQISGSSFGRKTEKIIKS